MKSVLSLIVGLAGAILTLALAEAAFEPINEARIFRYNGPGNALDQAVAIAPLPDGGAVVAGSSRGSATEMDMVAVRLTDDGVASPLWPDTGFGLGVRRYDGKINQDDRATGVTVGLDGSVYVVGYSRSLNTFDDYVVVKFNSAGAPCPTWPDTGAGVGVRRYTRLGGYDQAAAVAVDADGNVFVTGRSTGVTVPAAIVTLKYSPSGTLLWSEVYAGPGNAEDRGLALIAAGDGGVVVAGNSTRGNGRLAYILLRYNSSGGLSASWPNDGHGVGVRVFAGRNGEAAELAGMAALPDGGVVATGRIDAGNGNFAAATVAWSASGSHFWTVLREAAPMASDQGIAVGTTPDGAVVVASRSSRNGGAPEIEVLRYNSAGELSGSWADAGEGAGIRRWSGELGLGAFPTALALDRLGNTFVAGRLLTGGGTSEIVTIKIAPDGLFAWEDRYAGPGGNLDEPAALAIGADDAVLVAGRSDGSGSGADLVYLSWAQDLPRFEIVPPTILANLGDPLVLSATATGRPGATLTYSWFHDGVFVANGPAVSPGAFGPGLAGHYEIRVTDGYNILSSSFFVAGMGIGMNQGAVSLQLHGAAGRSLIVQASSDLGEWSEWQTIDHPGGTLEIPVPAAEQMFFRLALPAE